MSGGKNIFPIWIMKRPKYETIMYVIKGRVFFLFVFSFYKKKPTGHLWDAFIVLFQSPVTLTLETGPITFPIYKAWEGRVAGWDVP